MPESTKNTRQSILDLPLHLQEIKPEVLEYALDDPFKGIGAHFMNIEFKIDVANIGAFSMRKFDKRRGLQFKYTQYIKFQSNWLVKQSYNIVISQVLLILYVSNLI
jgi:hypothetical protein